MSITIKDIARLANVSHTTVSRALNDSSLVNEETKALIQKLAKEHNYIPNKTARSLKLDKSYNLGLFFTSLGRGTSSSFLHKALMGVNSIVKDQYNLVVRGVEDYKNLTGISRKHFDGIILVSQSQGDGEFIAHCQQVGIPLVVVNRQVEEDVSCYLSDDRQAAMKVVDHLIGYGHRHIAFIKGREDFTNSLEREKGYRQAMEKHHLPIINNLVVSGDYTMNSGYHAMNQLLEQDTIPTAVFCSNDEMAVGAMKALREKHLRVPRDMSMVGFDESDFAYFTTPVLGTVIRSLDRITKDATVKLMAIMNDGDTIREIKFYPSTFVHGQSMGKPNV